MLSLFTIMRRRLNSVGLKPGEVFLTFDDGPNLTDNVTPQILDVLHDHGVKAGFCLVGRLIDEHPEVVRRIYHSGHTLINHTHRHRHPIRQGYASLLAEVSQCDEALGRALGIVDYESRFFRAPYGIVTPAVRRVTRHLRMQSVLLSHYGWDTRVGPKNCRPVVDSLLENARRRKGGLFVFHDGSVCPPLISQTDWATSCENRSWIPQAVDEVITELAADGMKFVIPESTLSTELARQMQKRAA